MAEEKKEEIAVIEITEEYMKERIYEIRGQRVILDSDLSEIYGYTTKAFNQQVKNNIEKFDEDFMFELTDDEVEDLRSNFLTANLNSKSRYNPHVFTEQGLYMLMTVLKGPLAVKQSKALIRTFKRMKDYILENRDLIGQRELLQLSMETANNRIEISKINSDLGKQLSVLNANLHQAETIKTRLEQQMDNLDVTDIHYDKKISDLQRRLDTQYDKIDEVEEAIATERLIIDRIIAKIYSII
jgi:flagellar capping protein FliD